MKEGDVILTPLEQFDGKVKNRPAISFTANSTLFKIFVYNKQLTKVQNYSNIRGSTNL